MAAIEKIKDRWLDGEISTAQKREEIASENAFYYGRERKSSATGEILTSARGEVSHVPPARTVTEDPDPWGEDEDDEKEPWWQR